MEMEKTIIVILGCLGIGKTTLIHKVKEANPSYTYVDEPVDDWLKIKDNDGNILDKFYKDKKRWSYTFQNIAFITRLLKITDAIENDKSGVIILDGSLSSDKNIYAQMLHDDGFMTEMEWAAYNIWERFYEQHIKKNKVHYVYLHCDTPTIVNRIVMRNRSEESTVDPAYLDKVQKYLDTWVSSEEMKPNVTKCEFNCEIDSPEYKEILTSISARLHKN
jgi:deoxyadenosine/deoxycytidine kinase